MLSLALHAAILKSHPLSAFARSLFSRACSAHPPLPTPNPQLTFYLLFARFSLAFSLSLRSPSALPPLSLPPRARSRSPLSLRSRTLRSLSHRPRALYTYGFDLTFTFSARPRAPNALAPQPLGLMSSDSHHLLSPSYPRAPRARLLITRSSLLS